MGFTAVSILSRLKRVVAGDEYLEDEFDTELEYEEELEPSWRNYLINNWINDGICYHHSHCSKGVTFKFDRCTFHNRSLGSHFDIIS